MGVALYRKYRSQNLDEIVGQDHIVDILKNAINEPAHAYLFTGPRGVGKTSIARIMAYAINEIKYGETAVDIIEIDAASNGSVDDARNLREKAVLAPVSAKYKVYIIDEVHALSRQAFDALLKLIEEPPTHAIFMMATTEVAKVPATIRSRAQQYHFHLVDEETIFNHLKKIADKENIKYDEQAIKLLAKRADGSLRDALSLLGQLSNEKITVELIEQQFGLVPTEQVKQLMDFVQTLETEKIVETLNEMRNRGISAGSLAEQLVGEAVKIGDFILIEKLLEVAKSANPDLKLLAILANHNNEKSVIKTVEKTNQNPPKKIEKEEKTEEKAKKVVAEKSEKTIETTKTETKKSPESFNWDELVKYITGKNQATGAAYKNAQADLSGDELTLYFANSIYRKNYATPEKIKYLKKVIKEAFGISLKVKVSDKAKTSNALKTASAVFDMI